MKRIKQVILVVVLLAAITAAGGFWAYRQVIEPYRGYDGAEVFVDIPNGLSPGRIGDELVEAGVVRDPRIFRAALVVSGRARAISKAICFLKPIRCRAIRRPATSWRRWSLVSRTR